MFLHDSRTISRGFSFIELLVTVAITTLVFGGLLGSLQLAIKLVNASKASSGALALANERLEYIRSLPYNSVGTMSGIPYGPIPQNSTTTLNGVTYFERVLVQNIDAPEDGIGGADVNGILADYKQIKVEYSWNSNNSSSSISLTSNMVPAGIESVAGGGTLTVNVFDATVQPVSGASVRVYNNTTTSTIDTTVFTNPSGVAMFAGAPAAANYEITVTKLDHSTDQTYSATTSNPNPNPPHVAVLESAVSTMNFQIDLLSDLAVKTIGPPSSDQFIDDFDDLSKIAVSSNVVLGASSLILSGGAGSYAATGTALSASTTPAVITSWDTVTFTANTSASTSVLLQVFEITGTSTYTLIPDSDLPGNSGGFSSGPINISGLDPGVYPTLVLGTLLTTTDPNVTPSLEDWQLTYIVNEPGIGSVPFVLRSSKTIGTTASASPVYKYEVPHTTDGSGMVAIVDLEWDVYDLLLNTGAYDIAEACNDIPYVLDPDVDETVKLTLVANTVYSLRISVVDGVGDPIVGADVDLTRPGFSDSGMTSSCGQVFFNSGLAAEIDYQIDVSKAGYTNETITDFEIGDDEILKVTLTP